MLKEKHKLYKYERLKFRFMSLFMRTTLRIHFHKRAEMKVIAMFRLTKNQCIQLCLGKIRSYVNVCVARSSVKSVKFRVLAR